MLLISDVFVIDVRPPFIILTLMRHCDDKNVYLTISKLIFNIVREIN